MPMKPAVPPPAKTPRTRATKAETAKRPRGRPPRKPPSSMIAAKRTADVTEKDSGGEAFDIGGFTDLSDSESEVERRPLKLTPAGRQRK